jgi:hypothetical protein
MAAKHNPAGTGLKLIVALARQIGSTVNHEWRRDQGISGSPKHVSAASKIMPPTAPGQSLAALLRSDRRPDPKVIAH